MVSVERWGFLVAVGGLAAGCESEAPAEVTAEDTERVCYDGFDNDEDDAVDCADDGCDFATCCVGEVACCPSPAPVYAHEWSSCMQAVADCPDEYGFFGEPDPEILTGSIAPSESMWLSGAYLRDPIDPRGSRLRIIVEAAQPDCDGCLGTMGFGLAQSEPETFFYEDQLRLAFSIRSPGPGVEGGVVTLGRRLFGRFPVTDREFHRYAVDLFPDSTAQLVELDTRGDVAETLTERFEYDAPDPAYVVVFGRWQPPADPPTPITPGRIRRLAIERGACELPGRAFAGLSPVITHEVGVANVASMGRGLSDGGDQLVVVDPSDDAPFYAYEPDGDGGFRLLSTDPVLTAADLRDGAFTGISDPWLVADEAGDRWELYFTAWRGESAADIGRVTGGAGFAASFDPASFRVVASGDRSFPVLSEPTVLDDVMVVRASLAELGVFVRYAPDGPDRWEPYSGGPIGSAVVLRPRLGGTSFDSEAIADPALLRVDDMIRLYFAGRRGTRWAVGLAVSMGGEAYRRITGEEGLWPRPATGFGALWARDPAPIFIDGQVQMLFVGLSSRAEGAVGYATSGSPDTWPLPAESTPL